MFRRHRKLRGNRVPPGRDLGPPKGELRCHLRRQLPLDGEAPPYSRIRCPSHRARTLALTHDHRQGDRRPGAGPRACARSDPVTRLAPGDLRSAPLRSLPRPSRLEAPITALRGAGPSWPRWRPRSASRRWATCLLHVPHRYRDRSERPEARRAAERRGGHGGGGGALGSRAPHAQARAARSWRPTVADECGPGEGGLVQPGMARRPPRARARGCSSPASSSAAGFGVGGARVRGRADAAGIHTTGSFPSIRRPRGCARSGFASGPGRRGRWLATRSSRCRRSSAPAAAWPARRTRLPRRTFRTAWATRSGRASGWPSRSCSCTRRRWRRAARVAGRAGRASPLGEPGRAGGAVARLAAVRAHRRPAASDRGDRRRPGARAAHAAPADGRGGIGKTVLALYAMLRAVEAGYQAALMAPTETLAEQHARDARPAARRPVGSVHPADQRDARARGAARRSARLASGELGMVVGTHALIEPDVEFAPAGGLRRRRAAPLRGPPACGARRQGARGRRPHALHMTATPIPRTLSLTAYGDLDATVLRELPAGRKPVDTWVVGEEKRAGRLRVHPRAAARGAPGLRRLPARREGSPRQLEAKAAAEEAERLRRARVRRLRGRPAARPDARPREAGGDGGASPSGAPTCSWRPA